MRRALNAGPGVYETRQPVVEGTPNRGVVTHFGVFDASTSGN